MSEQIDSCRCDHNYSDVICNSTELASGIVSTALQCGTGRCPTDDLQLNTPVLVTIQHSEVIEVSIHYLRIFLHGLIVFRFS